MYVLKKKNRQYQNDISYEMHFLNLNVKVHHDFNSKIQPNRKVFLQGQNV